MKPEDCIRRRLVVDGDNLYLLVGADFATITGNFENRCDAKPISTSGAEKINNEIVKLRKELEQTKNRKQMEV